MTEPTQCPTTSVYDYSDKSVPQAGYAAIAYGVIALVTGLLALYVGQALAAWPHYLAYFNLASGGPAQGYRWLVDSNLDWGQDLPGLRRYLDEHTEPGRPHYLSYFGSADSNFRTISATASIP